MNRKWYRSGESLLHEMRTTSVHQDEVVFWYVGQCGFYIKGGVSVCIDVMLNDHLDADGNSKRYYASPFAPEELCADYMLCTHNHADHLAEETLQKAAQSCPQTRFLVPASCVSVLTALGIAEERIIPIQAGQTITLPNLTVTAVSTAHPVHQTDENGNDLSLAYLLEMNGVRLLHLGDTYLTERLLDDLTRLPSPHLFFPPINGQDYFRTARNCIGNLNAIEASELAGLLNADLTVPTHFDMFMGNTVDPLEFARIFMARNPSAKWHIPALGERFIYRL